MLEENSLKSQRCKKEEPQKQNNPYYAKFVDLGSPSWSLKQGFKQRVCMQILCNLNKVLLTLKFCFSRRSIVTQ